MGCTSQAISTWQWSNFLSSLATAKQQVVRINLDETCCPLCTEASKGAVAIGHNGSRKEAMMGEYRASLSARRSAVTLVASVCDDLEIQPLLPQVILGNERVLTRADAQKINAEPVARVYCLRKKSGWVNKEILTQIIELMGVALKPWQQTRYFLLCMDACPCHCSSQIARACNKAGLHLFYVAASMTSSLQPCDTHVFARFKRFLRAGMETLRLQSVTGGTQTSEVLQLISKAVQGVLNSRDWTEAFSQTGLRDQQRKVSKSLLRRLQWSEAPLISSTLPSLAQLQQVYPRNSIIPVADIFRLCTKPSPGEASEGPALGTESIESWTHRLRSGKRSRSHASQEESPAGSQVEHAPAPPVAAATNSSAEASSQLAIPRARRLFPSSWRPPRAMSQPAPPENL